MKYLSACVIVLMLCGAVCSDAPSVERGSRTAAVAEELELWAWVENVPGGPKPDVRGTITLGAPFYLKGPTEKGSFKFAEGRLLPGKEGKYRLPVTLGTCDTKGNRGTTLTTEFELPLDGTEQFGIAAGLVRFYKVRLTRPGRKLMTDER